MSDSPRGCGYELVVDLERGVLLRFVESVDGERTKLAEMAEVAFDEVLPDELFVVPPPDDPPAYLRPLAQGDDVPRPVG